MVVVVEVGLAEAPAREVVVVVVLAGTVVLVDVEVGVVPGVRATLGEVVVVGATGDVVVVVVELGAVPFRSAPPKNVCPEPDCPRTTADSGFCATSSMIVSVAIAITSAPTAAPSTGTRMSRQLRFGGRRRTDPGHAVRSAEAGQPVEGGGAGPLSRRRWVPALPVGAKERALVGGPAEARMGPSNR